MPVFSKACNIAWRSGLAGTFQPNGILVHRHTNNDMIKPLGRKVGEDVRFPFAGTDKCIKGGYFRFAEKRFHIIREGLAVTVTILINGYRIKRLVSANTQIYADIPGILLHELVQNPDFFVRILQTVGQLMNFVPALNGQNIPVVVKFHDPFPEVIPGFKTSGVVVHGKGLCAMITLGRSFAA